jgi:hypothetical protein
MYRCGWILRKGAILEQIVLRKTELHNIDRPVCVYLVNLPAPKHRPMTSTPVVSITGAVNTAPTRQRAGS